MKQKEFALREKLIIENEIKFEILKKSYFKEIYDYLEQNYIIFPYKNAYMCDYYYDLEDLSLSNVGITYRLRYRPQISINLKLPPILTDKIWSRYEYACKVDGSLPKNMTIFDLDSEINRTIKKYLGVTKLPNLINVSTVSTFRTGFILRYPHENVLGENDFFGVAFFDKSTNKTNGETFYEFELESFQQNDVFAAPHIFNDYREIGNYVEGLGHSPSVRSKKERCMIY